MSTGTTPEAGKHGITELDEFLDGFFELGGFTAGRLADGADIGDAFAFGKKILDKDFRNTMIDAVKGADHIPAEAKDLKPVELDYLLEKFKTKWLPEALKAFAVVAAANKKEPTP